VVVALVVTLASTVPVAAQPEGALPTSWLSFTGRVVDWAAGVWRVVAGSEDEPPPAEPVESEIPDGLVLDGAGETGFGTCEPQGERYPTVDPDG
jgi:hypothetical protein